MLRFSVLMISVLLAAGCTIMEMRRDIDERASRVEKKESDLQQAERTHMALQEEREQLLNDLRTRELTTVELKRHLQDLQRLNSKSVADTQQQRKQKALNDGRLSEARAQIEALEQDKSLSDEAKLRRLEELKQQVRKTLELMAET